MALPRLKRYSQSEYRPKHPRIQGVKRKPTEKRGWGPGWPDCNPGRVSKFDANRVGFRVDDRIGELLVFLFKASNALGYDIRRASEVDGGVGSYYCRAIKNSNPPVPSVHSIAVAIDQNSRGNVRFLPFRSVTPPDIVWLWEAGGMFWGGRFAGDWVDPMHFEQMFPPSEMDANLASAKQAFKDLGGTTLYPTVSITQASNRAMIRVLENYLNEASVEDDVVTTVLDEEGDWDTQVEAEVRAFQKRRGLVVDGVVGPKTWGSLLS